MNPQPRKQGSYTGTLVLDLYWQETKKMSNDPLNPQPGKLHGDVVSYRARHMRLLCWQQNKKKTSNKPLNPQAGKLQGGLASHRARRMHIPSSFCYVLDLYSQEIQQKTMTTYPATRGATRGRCVSSRAARTTQHSPPQPATAFNPSARKQGSYTGTLVLDQYWQKNKETISNTPHNPQAGDLRGDVVSHRARHVRLLRQGVSLNPQPVFRSPKPETRNPKPETRNSKPRTLNAGA